MQRALIQYRNPKNYDLVMEALKKAGREDLIGFGPECLIKPRKIGGNGAGNGRNGAYKANSAKSGDKTGAKQTNGKAGGNNTGGKSAGSKAPHKKKTIRNVHKKK